MQSQINVVKYSKICNIPTGYLNVCISIVFIMELINLYRILFWICSFLQNMQMYKVPSPKSITNRIDNLQFVWTILTTPNTFELSFLIVWIKLEGNLYLLFWVISRVRTCIHPTSLRHTHIIMYYCVIIFNNILCMPFIIVNNRFNASIPYK